MTTNPTGDSAARDSAAKDPDTWVTGDEPATQSQLSYVNTLAQDTGAEVPSELNKAQASQLIDELRGASPRVSSEESDAGQPST